MAVVFSKILTKTDIEKRLSVPSTKKRCFLDFEGKHKEYVNVIDEKGKIWIFGCSIRKREPYPKPVFSSGWLQFAHCWNLAVGDEVILRKKQDKAGKFLYLIEVIRSSKQRFLVQNRNDADRTKALDSYGSSEEETAITSHITVQASHSNVDDELTLTSQSTDHSITHDHPVPYRDGSRLEFFGLKQQTKARKPEFIDFLKLESREQKEREQPSFLTQYHVKSPNSNSTIPYYNFI